MTGQEAIITEALESLLEASWSWPSPNRHTDAHERGLEALAALVAERDEAGRQIDSLLSTLDKLRHNSEAIETQLAQAVAERDRYRDALYDYANPQHWAIRRNGTRYPDCIWIGPGATETVPNAPETARAALAVSTP